MQITKGRLLLQRYFDAADEVDLARATTVLKEPSRRTTFARNATRVRLANPPVEIVLPQRPTGLPALPQGDAIVRIYDVGAITITFSLPLPKPTAPEQLYELAIRTADAFTSISQAAQKVAQEVLQDILPACKNPEIGRVVEDYTVFYLDGLDAPIDAQELQRAIDIPRLLLADAGPIVEAERARIVQQAFSYRPDELVVVEWSGALVYDPQSGTEAVDILEFATTQLLEIRAYDYQVEQMLYHLYDDMEPKRRLFKSARYQSLSHRIMRQFVDVTEITERVDNALQLLGDTWLARLHTAAVQEFAIPHWQKQLADKLDLLRQINELLVDQISTRKSLRLEWAIVLLILLELFMALVKGVW